MLRKLILPPLSQLLFFAHSRGCSSLSFVLRIDFLEVDQITIRNILVALLDIVVDISLVVQLSRVELLALGLFFILMNQGETDVVFKFGNGEVKLNVCEFWILIKFFEDCFCESSNYWLFVVCDNVREELVDELDFEIGQVETSVIIAVELVRQVQNNFVFLRLFVGVKELVDQSIRHMLNLSMASDQVVKLEGDLVRHVQVCNGFGFVRNKDTLKHWNQL